MRGRHALQPGIACGADTVRLIIRLAIRLAHGQGGASW